MISIEIVDVKTEPKGKYRIANITYKGPDGKIEGKKVVSFGPSKDVFKVVSEAQQGDKFSVKSEKVGDFWNWTAIEAAGKADGAVSQSSGGRASTGNTTARSNYETPEERAKRQVYIVRQSQLTNAVEFLQATKGKAFNQNDVLEVAAEFVDFVFNGASSAEVAEVVNVD